MQWNVLVVESIWSFPKAYEHPSCDKRNDSRSSSITLTSMLEHLSRGFCWQWQVSMTFLKKRYTHLNSNHVLVDQKNQEVHLIKCEYHLMQRYVYIWASIPRHLPPPPPMVMGLYSSDPVPPPPLGVGGGGWWWWKKLYMYVCECICMI